jgi:GT2 family glycosyltransferase
MDYPANRWEAIVVDDGSDDATEDALRRWSEKAEITFRYLKQQNAGPAAARNRGAAAARGEALIFIDNDIVVQPDFIRAHLDALAAHPHCWIMGRVTHPPELRQTPFGRYRDALHESFYSGFPRHQLSETDGLTAQNVSMPTADFHRLGGFDESFTIASSEDWELAMRARQIGIRVLYHPGIVALHNDWAVSLDKFCERQRLYSVSDVLLWQKYGEASPRARLVRENASVSWNDDAPRLIIKKTLKRILATKAGGQITFIACAVAERYAPDSMWNYRAYNLAVALSIFRGVREGLIRYGVPFAGAIEPIYSENA